MPPDEAVHLQAELASLLDDSRCAGRQARTPKAEIAAAREAVRIVLPATATQ
jgi:hypothetical protein